ncbi:MAG: hypothetical protein QOK37_3560 [Thermoanaerobaculia bacterium]|jgi:hypothetical protein|nr:hypothetical protein [Thermoanaerobaculia bacterium]
MLRGIRSPWSAVHDGVARNGRTVLLLFAACLLAGSLRSTQLEDFPPVPQLPAAGWPLAESAEPFARALIARISPDRLDTVTTANPEMLPAVLRNLGTALLSRDPALQAGVRTYATSLVRIHAKRIPSRFSEDDLHSLVTLQVIDPLRYGEDEEFRRVVDTILPQSLDSSLPEALRRADLNELNRVAPIAFDAAEALSLNAGLVGRSSAGRFVNFGNAHATIGTKGTEVIEASIFSINSRFAAADEARRFLSAVRASAPKRRIIVIGDTVMRASLTADLIRLRIDFIDNFSRPLTLWPRDPFFVARASDGQVVFVNRPNLQPGREEDANMVRVLLQGLPKTLDTQWKSARWTSGTTPFHNGQVLLTPQAAWISIHSLEPRVLELLGRNDVPTAEFQSAQGIASYINAVRRAADELAALVGRPVRFVHDLPGTRPLGAESELMATLGGGAGFDLDSVITLLPKQDGSLDALIGDLSLGAELGAGAPGDDWQAFQKTYGLTGDEKSVRTAVVPFQRSDAAAGLQRFLDRCAKALSANGVHVRRLPLLMVPSSLLQAGEERMDNPHFLVTWNNVVLERGAADHAEGFASGLPSGDQAARIAFKASGYGLALFPPLPRSVVLNGGYRCASNEVRAVSQ